MTASRFAIAQDHAIPDPEKLQSQRDIREAIEDAALVVQENTSPGREQALVLTKLEEALMWAGKAVFA